MKKRVSHCSSARTLWHDVCEGQKGGNHCQQPLAATDTWLSVSPVCEEPKPPPPKSSCRMGSGPAHTTPQKPQSGMHCSTRNAWLPKDNLACSSCISCRYPTAVEGPWQDSQDSCLFAPCHGLCQAHAGNGLAMSCSRAVCPFSCRATDI